MSFSMKVILGYVRKKLSMSLWASKPENSVLSQVLQVIDMTSLNDDCNLEASTKQNHSSHK